MTYDIVGKIGIKNQIQFSLLIINIFLTSQKKGYTVLNFQMCEAY